MVMRASLVVPLAAMLIASSVAVVPARAPADRAPNPPRGGVTILVYHRFGPTVQDAMTVRTSTFRWQLAYLEQHGYPIVPLRSVVSHLSGRGPAPPPRAVVITADDGHGTVFTDMFPAVRERRIPVTLFIYPSAISNAAYAMRWEQIERLRQTGLFEIESHTFWHPNFNTERRRLTPAAYRTFVAGQFAKSKTALRNHLGVEPTMVAWPFGICNDELSSLAREGGFAAGFTLGQRMVTADDDIMALPRFLVTDVATGARFAAMLPGELK